MELKGEQLIPADQQTVWDALNNPDILKKSIAGCESFEKAGDDGFEAVVAAKIGPVKAKFSGLVRLSNLNPPESYTIAGEGKGGAAGFAKGGAHVTLSAVEGGTLLAYEVEANVGGKLAQLGSRLINATAKKMAADFFEKFAKTIAGPEVEADADGETPESQAEPAVPAEELAKGYVPILGLHPLFWTLGLVGIVIALIFVFSGGGH